MNARVAVFILALGLLLALLVAVPFAGEGESQLVNADFDSMSIGPVNPDAFVAALGGKGSDWAPNYDDMWVVPDSRGSGRVIRTLLVAGTIRSRPAGNNGEVLSFRLPGEYDQACISYEVKFDSNFDWSLGGKLPGLLGVAPGVAPSAPSGGSPTSEGWSGRLMWVGPGAYSWAGPTNMAISYMYHPGQSTQYGDNIQWNRAFVAGQWSSVKVCYAMNTVGAADGSLEAWMNGQRVVDIHDFVYRTRSDVHINYLEWDVFRGGATLAWAGSHDDQIDIDNMVVTGS